jgi:hypothetical protein
MNFKLIVASMIAFGVVSSPVLAATQTKHKHHHRMKHQVAARDYKDMGSLPIQPAPVCTISQNAMIMDAENQNTGRSLPNPCNPGWFNRIQMSGGLNVDLGKFGNRNTNFMGENYQRFSLNDAYFNVAANVNDWAKAFASISYNTASINAPISTTGATPNGEYSAAYSNNVTSGGSSIVQIEQAFATLGNLDMYPVYLEIGKEFQDFSRYEIHPITRSLTQVMSETLATSGKIAFIVPMGFHGGIFAFDDPLSKVGQTSKTTNYGAALGYDAPSDQLGWDVGAGYLYNLIGVNDVAYLVNQVNITGGTAGGGYNTRVGGAAAYADVNSGPFTVGARYTTALQRFNQTDLPKNGMATSTTGAKPWAAGITAGYAFEAACKNQNVYLGYQASREAAGLGMPKSRWLVGYGIDVFGKNTNVGVEWDHDMAYSTSNGGTNNNTNLVSVRSSVKFG